MVELSLLVNYLQNGRRHQRLIFIIHDGRESGSACHQPKASGLLPYDGSGSFCNGRLPGARAPTERAKSIWCQRQAVNGQYKKH